MRPKPTILILLIITFIITSTYLTFNRDLGNDESYRFLLGQEDLKTSLTNDLQPIGYQTFLQLPFSIYGFRTINILLTFLCLIPLMWIAEHYKTNPYITGILFITHAQVLNYTTQSTAYIPAILFTLLTIRYYLEKKPVTFLLTATIMVSLHNLTLLTLLAILLHHRLEEDGKWTRHILLTLGIGTVFTINYWMNRQYFNWLQTPDTWQVINSLFLLSGSILGFFLLGSLIITYWKELPTLHKTLLTTPIILLGLASLWTPIFHDRYLVLLIPATILSLAYLLQQLQGRVRTILTTLTILGAILTTIIWIGQVPTELQDANTIIGQGTVLHHSTFSAYPSMIYSPKAIHVLDLHNYKTSTPIIGKLVVAIHQPNRHYDYELYQLGKEHQNQTGQFHYYNNLVVGEYEKQK